MTTNGPQYFRFYPQTKFWHSILDKSNRHKKQKFNHQILSYEKNHSRGGYNSTILTFRLRTSSTNSNPHLGASITAPFEAKLIPARAPLTTMDIYPVIGSYESATNTDAPSVAITLDEQN